ncbi:hypothetical protein [Muriicola soli]|uniref:Lipocalin-like domain-containing protein n=1 Tax=Muriicola soli TaxID=2507538 RepID=A0A411EAG5_9FLAO|nr:hypothetical protein [Muriicola soli]QBA64721.1 hypothetical protein EQY75_09390 [Muriicola soli]
MKIKLFFAVFFLVIITSCSKDSSPSEPKISQDLLDAITGLYNLSEYIVSPPQDLNNDDVLSQDLMEELDCLSASIILREDLSYSKFAMQLNISLITNDLYAISCNFNQSTTGTWDLVNGQIVLSEESENSYALDGSVLTLTLGEMLPDFQSQVFVKQ